MRSDAFQLMKNQNLAQYEHKQQDQYARD